MGHLCRTLAQCHIVSPQVFNGAAPFADSLRKVMLAIMTGIPPPRPTHLDCTDELWALMQRCCHQDPHSRPEASEVLKVLRGS